MNKIDLSNRLAGMLARSRFAGGRSQEYMARALGVSRKTVQNWEDGLSAPSLLIAMEWFEALGVPMYPYIMEVLYPNEIEGISAGSDISDLRRALQCYVDELDDLHARELLFLLYGSHGSSPTGSLDALTAYLHLPLSMRCLITDSIVTHYEMAADLGLLQNTEHVAPCVDTLERYLDTARAAVRGGKQSYTFVGGKK